jgi:hypothetical protein
MNGHHLDADPTPDRHQNGYSGSDPDRHQKTMPIHNIVRHRGDSEIIYENEPELVLSVTV